MLNLLNALNTFSPETDYVLAIITNTQGSTYRKAGTLMLIDSELNYWGLLSGGCLEADIQQHSKTVFKNQKDHNLGYDMRGEDDLVWGMGLGCDGAIEVLLKYLPADKNHFGFFEVLQKTSSGQDHLIVLNSDNSLSFNAIEKHHTQIKLKTGAIDLPVKPVRLESSKQLLIPLNAPLNILICGASPDVPPVTALAHQVGWKTTVIDHRREFAQRCLFPQADQVLHIKRSEWADFVLSNYDAAVIMTHQFERDQEYLSRLLPSQIDYIGLLGPSKRRDNLLKECETEFSQQQGRVFGPVGLDIGADTPETIALAIIAEIQAVQAEKDVGFCYQDKTR